MATIASHDLNMVQAIMGNQLSKHVAESMWNIVMYLKTREYTH